MSGKVKADSVSPLDAALEGWGTAFRGVLRVGSLSGEWRMVDDDPGHGIHRAEWLAKGEEEDRGDPVEDQDDLDGEGGAPPRHEPLPADVSPFTFDMLRRAAAVEDGNAFFGTYDPEAAARMHALCGARAPSRDEEAALETDNDLSLQYDDFARHAARTLDGLNLVPDDLVAVALLGRRGLGLDADAATMARAEADGIAALARVAARALLDAGDAEGAWKRTDLFVEALTRLVTDTLSQAAGRIPDKEVATDATERMALSRFADQQGSTWKLDLRTVKRRDWDWTYYEPAHAADAAPLRAVMERTPDDDVKWLKAEPLLLEEGDEVSVVVLAAGEAHLYEASDGTLGPAGGATAPGTKPADAARTIVKATFAVEPQPYRTKLVGRILKPDGRWTHVYGSRVDDASRLETPLVRLPVVVDSADVFARAPTALRGRLDATLQLLARSGRFRNEMYELVRDGGRHDEATQAGMNGLGETIMEVLQQRSGEGV